MYSVVRDACFFSKTLINLNIHGEVKPQEDGSKELFRAAAVRGLETSICAPEEISFPIFSRTSVSLIIQFYVKRPLSHFNSNIRNKDEVKLECLNQSPTNIGLRFNRFKEFVVESMEMILFEDKRQAVETIVETFYSDDDHEETWIICNPAVPRDG